VVCDDYDKKRHLIDKKVLIAQFDSYI